MQASQDFVGQPLGQAFPEIAVGENAKPVMEFEGESHD